jgi:hypothetical protein
VNLLTSLAPQKCLSVRTGEIFGPCPLVQARFVATQIGDPHVALGKLIGSWASELHPSARPGAENAIAASFVGNFAGNWAI